MFAETRVMKTLSKAKKNGTRHRLFFIEKTAKLIVTQININASSPALEPVLQKVKHGLLQHVRHRVAFQRRSDEHNRPHGRHNLIRGHTVGLQREGVTLSTADPFFEKQKLPPHYLRKRFKMSNEEETFA